MLVQDGRRSQRSLRQGLTLLEVKGILGIVREEGGGGALEMEAVIANILGQSGKNLAGKKIGGSQLKIKNIIGAVTYELCLFHSIL